MFEIELPKRTAVAIAGSQRGELLTKTSRALNLGGQRWLIDKQKIVHQFFGSVAEQTSVNHAARIGCYPDLPAHACKQVHHLYLMFEYQ